MCIDVITRRAVDDADVRLRLGPVIEDDRTLCLDGGSFTSNNPSSSSIGSSSSRKPWSINRSYS